MKNKKNIITQEYLKQIPCRKDSIGWKTDENGVVTLEVENKGWANRLAQVFFNRPKISYIHLDKMGSFIWQQIDGNLSIKEIGVVVEKEFGKEANPLYERLAKYFQIINSYGFVSWINFEKK